MTRSRALRAREVWRAGSAAGSLTARALALVVTFGACACGDAGTDRLKATVKPSYDKATGRLTELTSDANNNGRIDTWTEMDGARPIRSRIDRNEDGVVDRWEYYDDRGGVSKVGISRAHRDRPDAWAYANREGRLERIEVSSTADEARIDRWEYYAPPPPGASEGALVRVEEDTNTDGRKDTWQTYESGALKTAEYDETGDGRPDRRLTYRGVELVSIESAPGENGKYTVFTRVK